MFVKVVKKLSRTAQNLFLAMVRQGGSPKRIRNKNVSTLGDVNAHGMTEGRECAQIQIAGPKQDFKSVQEREQELIDSVDP